MCIKNLAPLNGFFQIFRYLGIINDDKLKTNDIKDF
jgi:hypothetical protein